MGYIFNSNDTEIYNQWLKSPKAQSVLEIENNLIFKMLQPRRGESVIDIGCGTGETLGAFLKKGLHVTGIEPSSYMKEIALKNLGHRADLHSGCAEDLPFDDNSFDYACLIKTIEFADNPEKAIEEACRVAKEKVFIGIMNRCSSKTTCLRIQRIFIKNLYSHASFFSIWELKKKIKSITGNVPISWRTVCGFPSRFGKIGCKIEEYDLIQHFPFGAFAGIMVIPVPLFRTRPLELSCDVEPMPKGSEAVPGLAGTKWDNKSLDS